MKGIFIFVYKEILDNIADSRLSLKLFIPIIYFLRTIYILSKKFWIQKEMNRQFDLQKYISSQLQKSTSEHFTWSDVSSERNSLLFILSTEHAIGCNHVHVVHIFTILNLSSILRVGLSLFYYCFYQLAFAIPTP